MMKMKDRPWGRLGLAVVLAATGFVTGAAESGPPPQSVARQWNEDLLAAIRVDFARPTIHARNLYHVSVAMWDAWAVYDEDAIGVFVSEKIQLAPGAVQAAREEAISFAAYRVLKARFANSPGAAQSLPAFDARMDALGYDKDYKGTLGFSPAAVGNRSASTVLFNGLNDGANEAGGYANQYYEVINPPLLPDFPGNPDIIDPNRWQPLALEWFEDQAGNIIIGGYPEFLSPEWGQVTPFSLQPQDATIYQRDGFDYWVYHDPGPPPLLNGVDDEYYRWGFEQVTMWSGHLDPADGVMWDISPASIGNAPLPDPADYEAFFDRPNGGDWGTGYTVNPVSGMPYTPQMVPRGDYARILAEFWADGPDSETPPGHWFVLLNYVSDHPQVVKRLGGTGPILDDLQWDVKAYLAMAGGMHDVAIACWGTKGWYDYVRPISAIRYMTDKGQSTNIGDASYHSDGIRLVAGFIEEITIKSSAPGERHAHLSGSIGEIALYAWRGHAYIVDPLVDAAGVDWILAENWWPYQRPTFVTPPFAGYTSGHSTYSRAAAEIMTLLTGDEYFPGGMGEFYCPQNEFLVFEEGPSMDVTLQWAKYGDASDQCSLSRIWGGIHPGADDLPGRQMGLIIGPAAFSQALFYFNSDLETCPSDLNADSVVNVLDLIELLLCFGQPAIPGCSPEDINGDGTVDVLDLIELLLVFGTVCP